MPYMAKVESPVLGSTCLCAKLSSLHQYPPYHYAATVQGTADYTRAYKLVPRDLPWQPYKY